MVNTKPAPKIYTRTGDQGTTSLFGGARVVKDDPRLEAYGTLDELNSVVGILISDIENEKWPGHAAPEAGRLALELLEIQRTLFVLGSHLATESDALRMKLPRLNPQHVMDLESWMDRMTTDLPQLQNFILPGGVRPAASAHLARTVARRAERTIVALSPIVSRDGAGSETRPDWYTATVKQINRLNDYFFVLARHLNRLASREEPVWKGQQE